jgi:protein-S-isoprenylcysteine O-methyltransferase Ste14
MPSLELKIPPPIVTLLFALVMWLVARHTMPFFLQPQLKWSFIAVFVLLGLSFDIAGLLAFRSKQTTINPLHPEKSSSLVSHGIYRITRNPMYVGMACFLSAWALFLDSPMTFLGVPLFMLYISRFQIVPEEKILTGLFGETFTHYQTQVRRWL